MESELHTLERIGVTVNYARYLNLAVLLLDGYKHMEQQGKKGGVGPLIGKRRSREAVEDVEVGSLEREGSESDEDAESLGHSESDTECLPTMAELIAGGGREAERKERERVYDKINKDLDELVLKLFNISSEVRKLSVSSGADDSARDVLMTKSKSESATPRVWSPIHKHWPLTDKEEKTEHAWKTLWTFCYNVEQEQE